MAALLMLGEVLLEARLVHCQAVLFRQLAGHLNRKTIGRVQVERNHAVDDFVLAHTGHGLLKLALALTQRAGETSLFQLELLQHEVLVLLEFRIDLGILIDDDLADFGGEALRHTQLHAKTHGTADQAAQHVTLIDVAGADAARIAHDEGRGAQMVGHNAERLGGRLVVVIVLAGQLGNLRDDVRERVRLVDRLAAVEGADVRSRPMPVSTFFFAIGTYWPSAVLLYCMNTSFQISRKRPQEQAGEQSGPHGG